MEDSFHVHLQHRLTNANEKNIRVSAFMVRHCAVHHFESCTNVLTNCIAMFLIEWWDPDDNENRVNSSSKTVKTVQTPRLFRSFSSFNNLKLGHR